MQPEDVGAISRWSLKQEEEGEKDSELDTIREDKHLLSRAGRHGILTTEAGRL